MDYRPADDSDKAYFRELNEVCYRDVVARQFGSWDSDQQSMGFDVKWKEQRFSKIVIDDQVVGGVWIDELDDFRQLREIQIHPTYQGRGIGTKVVRDVIETSQEMGKALRLKVLLESQAVNLYKRLGFEIIGDTEVQYIMEHRT